MGREADGGVRNPRGDEDGEAEAAVRASKGGETTDATDMNMEQGERGKKRVAGNRLHQDKRRPAAQRGEERAS